MKDTSNSRQERQELSGKHYYQWQKHLEARTFINSNLKEKKQREERKLSKRQEKEERRFEKRYNGKNPYNAVVTRINKNRCVVYMENMYKDCILSVPLFKDYRQKLEGGLIQESLVAPGDKVIVEEGIIKKIAPRETSFFRKANVRDMSNKTYRQILASNIDYVAVFMPVTHPDIEWGLIDNIMLPCRKNNLKVIMVFNKCDLLEDCELENIRNKAKEYDLDPDSTFYISAATGDGTKELIDFLSDKRTFLCGISGAGKSTFLNLVNTSFSIETGEVNAKTGRGNHTTAFSTLYPLGDRAYLIDSPGIQVFDLYKVERSEIEEFIPQIAELKAECRFNNCTHINEDECNCAVKRAVANGTISMTTYERYTNLIYRNQ